MRKLLLFGVLLIPVLLSGQRFPYASTAHLAAEVATFPQVLTGTDSVFGGNATTHGAAMPNGVQVGDLILVFFALDGSGTLSINTTVSGNNWTLEDSASYDAADYLRGAIAWKVAEGSDTLAFTTADTEHAVSISYRISGYNATDPLEVTKAEGTGSASNPPSLTPSAGSDKYLWFVFGIVQGSSLARITAPPTDFSNMDTEYEGTGAGPAIAVARREYEFGSAYDPGAFTVVNEQWLAFTVIVKPT